MVSLLGGRPRRGGRKWRPGRLPAPYGALPEAAGLGRIAEAVEALTEVRAAFDFALATLELAAIYLKEGATARVRELAGEALALFRRQQVEHHALAALELFAAAAREETATLTLLWRLHTYLRHAEHARGLRFASPPAGAP